MRPTRSATHVGYQARHALSSRTFGHLRHSIRHVRSSNAAMAMARTCWSCLPLSFAARIASSQTATAHVGAPMGFQRQGRRRKHTVSREILSSGAGSCRAAQSSLFRENSRGQPTSKLSVLFSSRDGCRLLVSNVPLAGVHSNPTHY